MFSFNFKDFYLRLCYVYASASSFFFQLNFWPTLDVFIHIAYHVFHSKLTEVLYNNLALGKRRTQPELKNFV